MDRSLNVILRGLPFPRTTTGRASLLPPLPWHYSGDLLTVEYRTDPSSIAALMPEGVSRGRRGTARSRARSVQGGLRRRALSLRGSSLQSVPLHLGRQGLRSREGLPPGGPEETRLHSPNETRPPRPSRSPSRSWWHLRHDPGRE